MRKRDLSSRIDLLVHEQTLLGREVYLDFRRNPSGYSFEGLPEEAKTYLANSRLRARKRPSCACNT